MDLAGQQQFRAKLKLLKLQDLRFQEERLHGKKKRRMNTDMEDKYENEDEKEEADRKLKELNASVEGAKRKFREADSLYKLSEKALKEQESRSMCTIS
jgi:hypothetical protein